MTRPSQANEDPRCVRSRERLREALAAEMAAQGDLANVTVTAVADRAGLTRRTFYSHYADISSMVAAIEEETLADVARLAEVVASSCLDEVFAACDALEPVPGAVELLSYFKERSAYLAPLLGPGGDPRFLQAIKQLFHDTFAPRALHGLDERALGAFFDYYVTFAVSAECGVLERWLAGGMAEPVEAMARLMTLLMFVRPGDLYGNSYDMNVPMYGLALMGSMGENDE